MPWDGLYLLRRLRLFYGFGRERTIGNHIHICPYYLSFPFDVHDGDIVGLFGPGRELANYIIHS